MLARWPLKKRLLVSAIGLLLVALALWMRELYSWRYHYWGTWPNSTLFAGNGHGPYLAYGAGKLKDLQSGRDLAVSTSLPGLSDEAILFSPDATTFIEYQLENNQLEIWWRESESGVLLRKYSRAIGRTSTSARGGLFQISFSHDGKNLLLLSGTQLEILPQGQTKTTSMWLPYSDGLRTLSPDGRFLFCEVAGVTDSARLYEVNAFPKYHSLHCADIDARNVALSPTPPC